ncbi:MAG: hypothetical protein ACREOB_00575 [Thermodesulfobacteriota bacterium]
MKTFEFVALNSSGAKKLGTVRAWSLLEAKKKVQQRGFYVASIKIQESSDSHSFNSFSIFKELKEAFFSKKKITL